MLKLPKVTFRTMDNITKPLLGKTGEDIRFEEVMQKLVEEFASEQPALMTAISQFKDLGEFGHISTAVLIWKAIKTECECSELQSFLDVEEKK